jgi:hypothetical protein
MFAALHDDGLLEVVKVLVKAGADKNKRNNVRALCDTSTRTKYA